MLNSLVSLLQRVADVVHKLLIYEWVNDNGRLTCGQKLVETSLIYHTEPKQNRICSEEMANSQRPLSQFGRETMVYGGKVGFESGVKEWRTYGWWEWWIYGESWSDMRRKIRVRDGETGTRLSERSRELIPETRWGIAEITISYSWRRQWRWISSSLKEMNMISPPTLLPGVSSTYVLWLSFKHT